MSLPRRVDNQIRERFASLIEDGETLFDNSASSETSYDSFSTSVKSLFRLVLDEARYKEISDKIQYLEMTQMPLVGAPRGVLEILKGIKADYEADMLIPLSQLIESNVTFDYMEQAEQLLGGERHDHDHVPAAVLAGAVLENRLRRLCQQQTPPIETERNNGQHKTLEPLINDLSGRDIFSRTQAKQLKVWTDIRNHAAHGRFDQFDRAQVEKMVVDIQEFLAKIE